MRNYKAPQEGASAQVYCDIEVCDARAMLCVTMCFTMQRTFCAYLCTSNVLYTKVQIARQYVGCKPESWLTQILLYVVQTVCLKLRGFGGHALDSNEIISFGVLAPHAALRVPQNNKGPTITRTRMYPRNCSHVVACIGCMSTHHFV